MIFYAILKPNGCIDYAGIDSRLPNGAVVLPEGILPEHQLWIMYVNGEWVERPLLPYWERTPTGIKIENCPDEVAFEVYDRDTGAYLGRAESEDGALILDLPDPGTYRIDVSVPDPWLKPDPFTVSIEA